ncbi:MAG: radical SAM protein [Pseudonocardiaceae bacterium]
MHVDIQQDRALTQLVLKPTVFCYHRCPYCDLRQDYYKDMVASRKQSLRLVSIKGRIPNPGHMPLEMALHAIEHGVSLGMKSLQLSGGDPLLYPYLLEVIRAGASYPGVFVFMNSVGTDVTTERAREIIEAGLGAWSFSIDTLVPAKYEKLRGVRGALATIMAAVQAVREAAADRPDFCINYMTVITRHNFRDIPDVVRHCVETGVASIYLMNVYGDLTGASLLAEPEIREFRDETVPEILKILREKNTPEIVQTNAASVMASFFSADNPDSNYAQGVYWTDMESVRQACNTPNHYALVEPDGRVLPCCLVEISHEGEVGSVSDRSLADVWTDEGYRQFRKERIPFCQRCSSPRNRTLGLIPKMCRQFDE